MDNEERNIKRGVGILAENGRRNSDTLRILFDLHSKIDSIQKDLTTMKVDSALKPCEKNDNRLKLLERVVFGMVTVILLYFFSTLTPNAESNTNQKIINKSAIVREEKNQPKKENNLTTGLK